MKYEDKTKEQLINKLSELHQRVEDLDAEATKRKKAEEALKVSETLDLVKNSSPAHHETPSQQSILFLPLYLSSQRLTVIQRKWNELY